MMWRRFLQWIMDRRPTKAYVVEGSVLFYRAYLFTLFGRVWYLHHYLKSDPDDRGLHDHPMRARVVILAGGYDEERIVGFGRNGPVYRSKRRAPGCTFTISEYVFHRVVNDPTSFWPGPGWTPIENQPTSWSLFISQYVPGKSWGFLDKAQEFERRVPRMDDRCLLRYIEAGPGIDDEDPWWKTAAKGREVCNAPAGGRREHEPDELRPDPDRGQDAGQGDPGPHGQGRPGDAQGEARPDGSGGPGPEGDPGTAPERGALQPARPALGPPARIDLATLWRISKYLADKDTRPFHERPQAEVDDIIGFNGFLGSVGLTGHGVVED